MVDYSYWLKFVPVLLALAIGLIELWSRREHKSRLRLLGVTLLSLAAFAATCFIIWYEQMVAARSRNQDVAQWSRMEGKMGSEEMMQKYFDLVRQFNQEVISEKTGTALERFLASEADRAKRRNEVEQLNNKALSVYKIRFQPIYDVLALSETPGIGKVLEADWQNFIALCMRRLHRL